MTHSARSFSPVRFHRRLVRHASRRYRRAGRFAYHFALGKLGGDPMFRAILERGLISDGARILDLGCGQGLLAAWLLTARERYETGDWPDGWPAPGRPASVRGVDMLASDIARARKALGAPTEYETGDMCEIDFGRADLVVIMDVLHYVDFAAQADVLRRVRDALPPGGLLLTRIGDAAGGWGFRLSNWVDRTVARFRGNRLPPTHCRPLSEWTRLLASYGFSVETVPMNGNLPFANVMLIARRNAGPDT